MRKIAIFDTTLRDGEQTTGVCFSPEEKLLMTKALFEKGQVDRVEIASCKVSDSEREAVAIVMEWALSNGYADRVSVLSFVDGDDSIRWLDGTQCRHLNLLTKGSRHHCEGQLGKTPAEHFADIQKTVFAAVAKGCEVSAYLEDWSRGVQDDQSYVFDLVGCLQAVGVNRIYLCDTLGVLDPAATETYVALCVNQFADMTFEFHAHNDYGLATANCLAAVRAGAVGLHVTINGLGERAGNASLAEVVVAVRDFNVAETSVDESMLGELSQIGVSYSLKQIPDNLPIVGRNVFTHIAGIHTDGQSKGELYTSALRPERFGREWSFPLSKLSGQKALEMHLRSYDSVDLSIEEQKQLMKRIVTYAASKEEVTLNDIEIFIKEMKA